jgi:hypothetical protein
MASPCHAGAGTQSGSVPPQPSASFFGWWAIGPPLRHRPPAYRTPADLQVKCPHMKHRAETDIPASQPGQRRWPGTVLDSQGPKVKDAPPDETTYLRRVASRENAEPGEGPLEHSTGCPRPQVTSNAFRSCMEEESGRHVPRCPRLAVHRQEATLAISLPQVSFRVEGAEVP